jgi:hypothetical protein
MNEEPTPLAPALQQAMDEALRPLFGENLPAYYAEVGRYDTEIRDIIERARRVAQELIDGALDRLTFFGGERRAFLGCALENTQAQRAELDRELHERLVTEKQTHHRRVAALRVVPDEE